MFLSPFKVYTHDNDVYPEINLMYWKIFEVYFFNDEANDLV